MPKKWFFGKKTNFSYFFLSQFSKILPNSLIKNKNKKTKQNKTKKKKKKKKKKRKTIPGVVS